ncbi:HXXEE domain-containing protein [Bradyrhizobium sp. Ash2021]|uniref:HXXEE domain-containing protein n=1 Tax=Bradyrhizobium sp. Ash2021 TaxID=2954771 RepID=UPI002815DCE5|nr:HXXEE domain-containing protein [Bradyrhizobium sp. Ash2021]WMT73480.1 HXXEE domain-containing protein [Bradyrhizobium sp. Ash2021]
MMDFVTRHTLDLLTGLAMLVAVFIAVRWSTMPVLQRLAALFFIGIVAHLWEEERFPGGFTQLMTDKVGFTATNPHFGEMVLAAGVLALTFVPLFLPRVPFLVMASLLLGILEAIAHTAAIWMFKLDKLYSPGLVTALFVLLPLSLYGISYAVRNSLMTRGKWALSFLYMFGSLLLAQQLAVRASGMPYSEFLRNIKSNFAG